MFVCSDSIMLRYTDFEKSAETAKPLGNMKKKLVNVNNNVGYDLKMNKYNPILLKRIFLHSFLSFSFAYFTKNHCYYVIT